jgi:UDP-N-acetylmuramate dehydrogenase
MIRFIENADLRQYNTFRIPVLADLFYEFTESNELVDFLERFSLPEKLLVLGGGSNLLFSGNFNGLVLHPNVQGIVEVDEDRNFVYIEAGAGVEWDELVSHSVTQNLGGLENLSLIPGKVGACPVQNIGAYGVEAKDCIEMVRAVSLENGKNVELSKDECRFGYRDSIFKNQYAGKLVITSVLFKLNKFPEFNIEYGDVKTEVGKLGGMNVYNIRKAIVGIRSAKLPDYRILGNAGSFFKNPAVDVLKADELRTKFPKIPLYDSSEIGKIKVAAGWLIDQCGWKGKRIGDAGVHEHQALVLVNHGNASGQDILLLSESIEKSVFEKFGIPLEKEVILV